VEKPKRGGLRTSVVASAVDSLIEEDFFKEFKNSSQVLDELKRRNIPSKLQSVNNALNRRVPKILERVKGEHGRWVYRKRASKSLSV